MHIEVSEAASRGVRGDHQEATALGSRPALSLVDGPLRWPCRSLAVVQLGEASSASLSSVDSWKRHCSGTKSKGEQEDTAATSLPKQQPMLNLFRDGRLNHQLPSHNPLGRFFWELTEVQWKVVSSC